jgi:sugar transferase (PEP-CTERM/EpsH1 system associated)
MRDLLFLAHRIPYPPNKGDKIRSWNILRHLARRYRVHLGCFIDDPRDAEHAPKLKEICGECCIVPLDRRWARLRSLRAFLTGAPLTLPFYRDARLAAFVDDVMGRIRPEVVFYFSSSMAQYGTAPRPNPPRRIVDFVDVDSEKWADYARRKTWPQSLIFAREARALLAFERRVAAAADASLFVSAAEAALFESLAPESRGRVFPVCNGVDAAYFSPDRAYERPFPPEAVAFVFTGAMDYWPNIDAVQFFADAVMPLVRDRRPDASFWIVGSNPAAAVTRLAERPGIVVTGRVPDVRPYLAHAAAVVAPLRIARGIQNKVLEAMAMAKPIVATGPAVEGIGATQGRHYFVADDPKVFADCLVGMVNASRSHSLGAEARAYVLSTYDWDKNMCRLDAIIGGISSDPRR